MDLSLIIVYNIFSHRTVSCTSVMKCHPNSAPLRNRTKVSLFHHLWDVLYFDYVDIIELLD